MAIVGFRHKGLQELFETGRTARVGRPVQKAALLILDRLNAIAAPDDCRGVRGFHELRGDRKGTYALRVTGNWRITFRWQAGGAADIDLEDYHWRIEDRFMFRLSRRPTLPGVILREDYLKPRRIPIARLAEAVGCSRKHMSDIVNGKARLEASVAARLAKVLGTSTQFWITLQANVDAYDAERAARGWRPTVNFLDSPVE